MEERYGKEGISFLVDEGFTGVSQDYGALVASLGMAEKGSVNVRVKVETLGGHSSVPPVHTGSKKKMIFPYGAAPLTRCSWRYVSCPGGTGKEPLRAHLGTLYPVFQVSLLYV